MGIKFENYQSCIRDIQTRVNSEPQAVDEIISKLSPKYGEEHVRSAIGKLFTGENAGKYRNTMLGNKMGIEEAI